MADDNDNTQVANTVEEIQVFSAEDQNEDPAVRELRQVKKLAIDVTYEQAVALLRQISTVYSKDGTFRKNVELTAILTYGTYTLTTSLDFESKKPETLAFPSDVLRIFGGVRRIILSRRAQIQHPSDVHFLNEIDALEEGEVDENYIIQQQTEVVEFIVVIVTTYYKTLRPDQKPKSSEDISKFFAKSEIVKEHAEDIFEEIKPETEESEKGARQTGTATVAEQDTQDGDGEPTAEPEEDTQLQTLYGQDRDKAYFDKQRRIQNESAWMYNRALYELFHDVGVSGADIPPELQQQLFIAVRTYALSLEGGQLDKLFASPSARQRALIRLFAHLEGSGFRSQLREFYLTHAASLPPEQRENFTSNIEKNERTFGGEIQTLDEKFTQQLEQTLHIQRSSSPLEIEGIKQRIDELIMLYGSNIDTVVFDGNELSIQGAKQTDDLEEFLKNFLTREEIKSLFDLPNNFELTDINITEFRNIVINYSRQHAAVLLVEGQSAEFLQGTVSLTKKFEDVKNNPAEKQKHIGFLRIASADVSENGAETILAAHHSNKDKKYQKVLRQYKSFLPLWNGLSTAEQIEVYKVFNYPTKHYERANDPSKKLPFIVEFIGFDVSTLELLTLRRKRGYRRRPGLLQEKEEDILDRGKERQKQLFEETIYLTLLSKESFSYIEHELANHPAYANYTYQQKALLLERILELKAHSADQMDEAIYLQKQLIGEESATIDARETELLVAKFSSIRHLAAAQKHEIDKIIDGEGRQSAQLIEQQGPQFLGADELAEDFFAIAEPIQAEYRMDLLSEEDQLAIGLFAQQQTDELTLAFFSQEMLMEQAQLHSLRSVETYAPVIEQSSVPDLDAITSSRIVMRPESLSVHNLQEFLRQELINDIQPDSLRGRLKKWAFNKAFPPGEPDGINEYMNKLSLKSRVKGKVKDKLKEKFGDQFKKMLSKGGWQGMLARMVIDSKYRKKKLLQALAIGGGATALLISALKGMLTSVAGGIGGVVGGVIGGGLGFLVGGPVGAVAGAMAGAGIGSAASSYYLPKWFPEWFGGESATPVLSEGFALQPDFAPSVTNPFSPAASSSSASTAQAANITRRVNSALPESSSAQSQAAQSQAIRAQQARAAQAAANQALTQQALAEQLASQSALQQAFAANTLASGLVNALTSAGILIPGGAMAIILVITLYNLMVINSAFLIPVPPDIGVGNNDYCRTGIANKGCFIFDTAGGDVITYNGENNITLPFSAIEQQRVENAFAKNAGKYPSYVNLLCSKGPITMKKLSNADAPGPGVYGWTLDDDTFVFYERGVLNETAAEVTFVHESGHIIDRRHPSGSSIGLVDDFATVWSGDPYTYSGVNSVWEAFAEGILNYVLPGYTNPLVPGANDLQDFPDEYQWFSENIFGSQNGQSCGGPVTGNVGNKGDIYIAVGSNDKDNVVITQNTEINDSSSTFNSIAPCRWREIKNLEASINANFFNAGNIPVGPAGANPVKYYANQTHVNTPNYMVDNVDTYVLESGEDYGKIEDIKQNWQDRPKPFVMNDYNMSVSGLVALTSNVSDQRRKVALGVSSDKKTMYLGVLIEGNYTELKQAMENQGADKLIFLDGGNSAAFCPQPGERFTTGEVVPTLKANRTVPINVGMKTVDNFIKIDGTN